MESEFLLNIKELSLEAVTIAFLVFGITMLVKWSIKKFTSKFEENKRKAINTVIAFIPIILAFGFSMIYFCVIKGAKMDDKVFEVAGSSYLLSVFVYAVCARVKNIVLGIKKSPQEQVLDKEAVAYIKQNIKTISKALKLDETKLEETVSKIQQLLNLRDNLAENVMTQDIVAAEKLGNEIDKLKTEKNLLEKNVVEKKNQINNFKESLKNN